MPERTLGSLRLWREGRHWQTEIGPAAFWVGIATDRWMLGVVLNPQALNLGFLRLTCCGLQETDLDGLLANETARFCVGVLQRHFHRYAAAIVVTVPDDPLNFKLPAST